MKSAYWKTPEAFALSSNVQRLRKARGMTQEQLADGVGVSGEEIGRWERGVIEPKLRSLLALSRALGVTLDELVSAPRKQREAA